MLEIFIVPTSINNYNYKHRLSFNEIVCFNFISINRLRLIDFLPLTKQNNHIWDLNFFTDFNKG